MNAAGRGSTGSPRVQAVDRLVEQQHARVAEQGGGDAQPLRHAERERPGPLARYLLQPGQGEDLLDPGPRDRVACAAARWARAPGRVKARASSSAPTSRSGHRRSR